MNGKVEQATQIVHWPGNDTPACEEHAGKIRRLAQAMGFSVSCSPIENVWCTNCVNEAEKAKQAKQR